MIAKTKGIVFRFTKFRETSIIVTIFTEVFGVQNYVVNGVRSRSPKGKIALYQPLTLLDLVVYHRENANIERIKEIQCFHPYRSLTADVKKSSIAMFINELINKVVRDESHSQEMFTFLSGSLIAIDDLITGYENAHLIFMIRLSRYLGFGPQFANEIMGGRLTNEETEKGLELLMVADYEQTITLKYGQRKEILDLLIRFYADHLGNLGEMKSVTILREVLS